MERIGYINNDDTLDALFGALSDRTRRAMLRRLAKGEASVGELAEPFAISQPAISKHLKVLERAGLVDRAVAAQRRPARLNPDALAAAVIWLESFQDQWNAGMDRLDDLITELKQEISDD